MKDLLPQAVLSMIVILGLFGLVSIMYLHTTQRPQMACIEAKGIWGGVPPTCIFGSFETGSVEK